MFDRVPNSKILNGKEREEFIKWLGEELLIKKLEDWYRVSWSQIGEKVSLSVFKMNPLGEILQQSFPDHNWDVARLESRQRGGRARTTQRHLVRVLEDIFPNTSKENMTLISL